MFPHSKPLFTGVQLLPVVCRPKGSSGVIHKIGAQNNVASGVDCDATFVQRRKSIVHLLHPGPPSFDRNIPIP